jgi:hypothetical protein
MQVCMATGGEEPMQFVYRLYPKNIDAMRPPIKVDPMPNGVTDQNEVEPRSIKPSVDEAIRYRLAQDPPTVHKGVSDAAGLGQAQREDPTCHEVLTLF